MPKKHPFLFPEEVIENYKITKVVKRDGRVVPFNKERICQSIYSALVEVHDGNREKAELLADKVVQMISSTYVTGMTPTVEEIQDLTEKALAENGHFKAAKAYILYRQEHKRLREKKESRIVVEDNIPYKVIWKTFTWNVDHGCDTIGKLNKQITEGSVKELIADSEDLYNKEILKVTEKIAGQADKIRIAIVAGPSSSGKTTTTIKISEALTKHKLQFVTLNLDNYFKSLEEHPQDEYGDYDFETPYALDLPLINKHLEKLLDGKSVKIPKYDFKTGKKVLDCTELKLNPGEILLIDSLHGLFDETTASVSDGLKFKIYIEVMCQIRDNKGEFMRWADLRMLRRMVRDSWHRAYDPVSTVGHWHYVRSSEMKYIVPFINKADYIFNSALAYELPVYKHYLFSNFYDIIDKYQSDPKKLDAFVRAKRVFNLLQQVNEIKDNSTAPQNSLIREFIGGSVYKY